MKFNYTPLQELANYLNNYGKFNQTAICKKWGLTSRTLYNVMHSNTGSLVYSNYIKIVGICNELEEMKLKGGNE